MAGLISRLLRRERIAYTKGATTLGNLASTYDAAGRSTSLGGSFARTGLPQAVASATYDPANELTQWGTTTLTYDANGNLTSFDLRKSPPLWAVLQQEGG